MRRRQVIALVPILFGIWFFFGLAPYGVHVGEDGDVLYQIFATYRGKVPYVDFSTGYTPGFFYWHAGLFWLFGVDAIVTRISVALANTVSLYLLYRLAARVVPPALALLAPLLFVGSLLAYPGDFCTFNVPYPAWYNIALWLGSMAAVCGHLDRSRLRLLFVAGLLAGLSFSVKPNIGLFNLVALSFFIAWWHAPAPSEGWLTRAAWLGLALATAGGVVAVFWSRLGTREFQLFPLPVLVLAGVLVLNAHRAPGKPGFVPAAAMLLLGFALPTVPWLLYFLVRLGLHAFLRDVMMVGSSYELFFFIPHRLLWGQWDVGVLALGIGLASVPTAVRRHLIPPWLPLAAAGTVGALATGYVVFLAPMREGFYAAVATRVQDLAFFLIHAMNWSSLVIIAREVVRHPARRTPFFGSLVLVAVSATALMLGMYPRSDFMHLLISAPCSIILGVVLLGRVLRQWLAALPDGALWRWGVTAMLVTPAIATACVLAAPAVTLAATLYWHYLGLSDTELVRLNVPRASLIMDPGGGRRFHALHDAAQYIERHTQPDDTVFPFPNLNLLCFLAGRLNQATKGYFHPGFPDHPAEAEIVSSLRQRMPRLVLSLHDHELFITSSPLYYFLIRDFVHTNFVFATRVGPYDILTRRGGAMASPAVSPPADEVMDAAAWAGLNDPDPNVQRDAALRIRQLRDPLGAVALAQHARGPALYRVLYLRIVGEFGDERAVPPLVEIVRRGINTEVGQTAATALFYIAGKSILEQYWFAPYAQEQRIAMIRPQLDPEAFRAWLRNRRTDARLRYVAAWGAGVLRDQVSAPLLVKMLETFDLGISTVATYALMKLGHVEDTAEELVASLDRDDTYLPSILIDLYRAAPAEVRPVVQEALQGGTPKQRETLSYIAAALHDPALVPLLSELREDTDPHVQRAATWAVESLKGEAVMAPPVMAGVGVNG